MREDAPHRLAVLGIFRPMSRLTERADETVDEMAVSVPEAARDDDRAADHPNSHRDCIGHYMIGNFRALEALDGRHDAAQHAGAKRGGSLDAAARDLHEFDFLGLN